MLDDGKDTQSDHTHKNEDYVDVEVGQKLLFLPQSYQARRKRIHLLVVTV